MTRFGAGTIDAAHLPVPRRVRDWVFVFGLVVLAHGGLLALLSRVTAPVEPAEEPAMLIDMAPIPAPDAPPQPIPTKEPDPLQTDAVPPPSAEPPLPTQTFSAEPVPPEPNLPDPPLPEVAKPAALVPQHPPAVPHPRPVPHPPSVRTVVPTTPAAEQAASPVTAPPALAGATPPASASASWQGQLIAHLNRFKRYPPEAQIRQRQGTAVVQLRLLPNGSAEAVRLLSSSGTNTLDEEAVALIARAQPLPVPDRNGSAIVIAVPIQFMIR
jgi:protein TonB